MAKTLAEISSENHLWAQRNFGNVPTWQPLLGIVEEVGELYGAETAEDEQDAIGDIQIYLVDYTRRRGWDLSEILETHIRDDNMRRRSLVSIVGELAHAHLKEEQKIRGTAEEHQKAARYWCAEIMRALNYWADTNGWSAHDILERTWAKVSQRNWRANALTGGER